TARRLTLDSNGDGKTDQYGFRGEVDCSAFGASLLTPDKTRPAVETPEMQTALEFHLRLIREGILPPPRRLELEEPDALQAFQSGQAAMIATGNWSFSDLRKRMGNRPWDIVSPPVGSQRAHWASSVGFCIARETRHPDASWRWMRYLLTSDTLWPLAQT